MLCGAVGVLTGGVPFVVGALRVAGCPFAQRAADWAVHGVEALGLGLAWAVLSSANGAMLGGLLLAAGVGWRRGRPWAPAVTLAYAVGGLLVNGVDLALFALLAHPGPTRSTLLVLDSLTFAVAAVVLIALVTWWRRRAA
ncbi:MAG: hypothetical protein ACODAJ_10960 [Planctomycetota bacterium]